MNSQAGRSVVVAVTALLLVFAWQVLTVRYNYGGNWTALFCTGEKLTNPPELDSEGIYRFQGSSGYDGQFYHYMAHDPFLRRGFAQYMDAAKLRYRRILVPAAAYLLAGGQDRFVDTALLGVIWFLVFAGVYWSSRFAALCAWHPAWGLGFLLVPATIVAVDRTVVDVALVALTAGLAYYSREGDSWKIYLVLVCAALTRETGLVLAAGYCLYLLYSRLWVRACMFATAVAPALIWLWFAAARTSGDMMQSGVHVHSHTFARLRILRMGHYKLPGALAATMTGLDYLMVVGVLLSMVLTLWLVLRPPRPAESLIAFAYLGLMVPTVVMVTMFDPFTYARIASPLLLLVALQGVRNNWYLGFAPLALVTLRTAVQLAPQALGVLRGLLGR